LSSFKYHALRQNTSVIIMVEVKKESTCQICDSYNMKGMWQCECGVMNVSKNVKCWKCGRPRTDDR